MLRAIAVFTLANCVGCAEPASSASRSGLLSEEGGGAGSTTGTGGTSSSSPSTAGTSGASGTAGTSSSSSGGTSGTAGTTSSGGTAGTGSSAGSSGSSGSPPTPPPTPVSTFCGDGIRDPLLEECDGGTTTSLCSPSCRRLESTVWTASSTFAPLARRMGAGVHPVASGSFGHAVVTESQLSPGSVFLTLRNTFGGAFVTYEITGPHVPAAHADPVVALTTTGYVAAWTASSVGGDGDELGIALQPVGSAGPGPIVFANTSTSFSQRRPDVLWTGTELVVAWEDMADLDTGPDLRIRSFSASLVGGAETTLAGTAAAESRVALAPHGGSYVAAWRAAENGLEHVRVQVPGGEVVSMGPHLGADAEDAPAVVALSVGRVLVVYARTEEGTTRLRAAVADVATGTLVVDQAIVPVPSGYDAVGYPSLTTVGGAFFLSWTARQHIVDGEGDETVMQQIAVVDDVVSLVGAPRWFPQAVVANTDSRRIRLAARRPDQPNPALFVAWEDDSPPLTAGAPRPDVGFSLLPYPILDLPPGEP